MTYILVFVIALWLLLVISLLIVYFIVKKHLLNVLQAFQNSLDEVFFQLSRIVYTQQDKIIRLDEFLALFERTKKNFFAKENKDVNDFLLFWEDYKKDINYLGELLEQDLKIQDRFVQMEKIAQGLSIVLKWYQVVRKVLCILTLGIFCLFSK